MSFKPFKPSLPIAHLCAIMIAFFTHSKFPPLFFTLFVLTFHQFCNDDKLHAGYGNDDGLREIGAKVIKPKRDRGAGDTLILDSSEKTNEDIEKYDFSQLNKVDAIIVANLNLTDTAFVHISKTNHKLKLLDLFRMRISDKGIIMVLQQQKEIETLLLNCTSVGDFGALEIAKQASITTLGLSRSKITDQGVICISKMRNLQFLELEGTKISDKALEHLANLPKLFSLTLNETNVTDGGILHLAGARNLQFVDLSKTKVTQNGKKKLKVLRPSLTVR